MKEIIVTTCAWIAAIAVCCSTLIGVKSVGNLFFPPLKSASTPAMLTTMSGPSPDEKQAEAKEEMSSNTAFFLSIFRGAFFALLYLFCAYAGKFVYRKIISYAKK